VALPRGGFFVVQSVRPERTSMSKKKRDFKPNDFVVYPAHGVGKVVMP